MERCCHTELRNNPNAFAVIALANLYVLQTKNDPEKRLSLKEHVYEIARTRNYSEAKISSLLTFITELIILPEELREEFNTFISNPAKFKDMKYLSEQSLSLADAILEVEYGKSASGLLEERASSIALLYTKFQVSIEEIAQNLKLDTKTVRGILKKQGLIKK